MLTRVGVVVVTGAITGVAAADTVDVKFLGAGRGTANWVSINGNTRYVFAGQLNHRFSNGVGEGELIDGDFITFCTDLTQYVSATTKTFTVESLEDLPNSPGVPAMGADAAQAVFDIYKAAGGAQLDPGADSALASAFQLAVWEIVYDYDAQAGAASLDIGQGNFRVTAFQKGYANAVSDHLTSLFGSIGIGGTGEGLYGIASGEGQDQLVVVPMPAPIAAAGVGLISAYLVRRRVIRP